MFVKKPIYFFVLLFFSCFLYSNLLAQEKTNLNNTSKIAFAEKIYLQLNSTVFTSDQTIWLKAIVTNANQKPTVLSNILHVDLINFDEKTIVSKLLKLENGIASSFFDLQQILPLPAGKYILRAYTKWNTNFTENLVSQQYIDIYKPRRINTNEEPIRNVVIAENSDRKLMLSAKIYPRTINPKFRGKLKVLLDVDGKKETIDAIKNNDKDKSYSFNYLLPDDAVKAKIDVQLDSVRIKNFDFKSFNSFSKTIAIDKKRIDLQFFPEGGKLIHGLKSIVGFKALDYKNEGIPIEGMIKDENGTVITEFKSNQLGMGFYQLKPDKNKAYQALIKVDKNLEYKFEIPKVYDKGYGLTITKNKGSFNLQLRSNFSLSDSLLVKAQARGIVYSSTKAQCKKGKLKMSFNTNLFPEGIVTFTVFNKQNQPICERLVFNYKKESNRLKIISKTDKKRYLQRDKIIFDINIKNTDTLNKSTSFLVLNKKQLGNMHLKQSTILSYFLLESELKGTIEQPSYYFDTNNKHRFYAMDALLLTQGWRNYIFKPTEEKFYFTHQPEKNLQISGSIKGYEKRKRKKPIQLTLIAKGKENMQAAVSLVDSLGKFSFNLQDMYNDDLEYIIQTQNHKGKKREYSLNFNKTEPLPVDYKKIEKLELANEYETYLTENIKRYEKLNPFSVGKNGFELDEVEVKTRLLSSIQEKMNEEHGEPDIVIEHERLMQQNEKWMSGLFSLLTFKYTNDLQILNINSRTSGSFLYPKVYNTDFTFVIVDGTPVRLNEFPLLETINVEEIKSLEIIKFPKNSNRYYIDVFGKPLIKFEGRPTFSFLNIYSHGDIGLYGITTSTIGIFKNTLPSFSTSKEFYAPKHENLTKSDWDIPDLRSTVFWQPNVSLDKKGNGKIEFYNDDTIGEMLVIIECIDENGKLGYYETIYKVNERFDK